MEMVGNINSSISTAGLKSIIFLEKKIKLFDLNLNNLFASKDDLDCFSPQTRHFLGFFLVFITLKLSSKSKAIGLGKITIFDESFFLNNTYLNKVVASQGHLDCFSRAKR